MFNNLSSWSGYFPRLSHINEASFRVESEWSVEYFVGHDVGQEADEGDGVAGDGPLQNGLVLDMDVSGRLLCQNIPDDCYDQGQERPRVRLHVEGDEGEVAVECIDR